MMRSAVSRRQAVSHVAYGREFRSRDQQWSASLRML